MNLFRNLTAMLLMGFGGFLIVTAFPILNYVQVGLGLAAATFGFVFLGRGLSRGRKQEKFYVALDFISVTLIAVFFLSFLIAGLGGLLTGAQATINLTLFLLAMEFGGILMAFITGVLRLTMNISGKAFALGSLYITVNFSAFFILNLVVPPSIPIVFRQGVTRGSPFTAVMISVPEETVFDLWLPAWLANLSKTGELGGAFMKAVIGTTFHLFVYGTDPAALGVVFGAFFATGFTALKMKVLWPTLVNHFGNNVLSVGLINPGAYR